LYNSGAKLLHRTITIERILRKELETLLGVYPIVTTFKPRQSDKTTLARHYLPDFNYHNRELPKVSEIAEDDPKDFLADADEPVILDEIQRVLKLLSYLQSLMDEGKNNSLADSEATAF